MCSFVVSVSFLFSAVVIISQMNHWAVHILGALLVGVLRVENSEKLQVIQVINSA